MRLIRVQRAGLLVQLDAEARPAGNGDHPGLTAQRLVGDIHTVRNTVQRMDVLLDAQRVLLYNRKKDGVRYKWTPSLLYIPV